MKLPIFALLVAVSIVPSEALLTTAWSLAETPLVEPCEGLQGGDARDCLDAYELLTRELPAAPKADISIAAARSAEGWRYRFLGSGAFSEGSDHAYTLRLTFSRSDAPEFRVLKKGGDVTADTVLRRDAEAAK